jgi:hypothetical protein
LLAGGFAEAAAVAVAVAAEAVAGLGVEGATTLGGAGPGVTFLAVSLTGADEGEGLGDVAGT